MSVQAALETRTEILEAGPNWVHGKVSFVDTDGPVPDGGVVLIELGDDKGTWTVTTPTKGGMFRTKFEGEEKVRSMIAHYLGAFGAAASESKRVDV